MLRVKWCAPIYGPRWLMSKGFPHAHLSVTTEGVCPWLFRLNAIRCCVNASAASSWVLHQTSHRELHGPNASPLSLSRADKAYCPERHFMSPAALPLSGGNSGNARINDGMDL